MQNKNPSLHPDHPTPEQDALVSEVVVAYREAPTHRAGVQAGLDVLTRYGIDTHDVTAPPDVLMDMDPYEGLPSLTPVQDALTHTPVPEPTIPATSSRTRKGPTFPWSTRKPAPIPTSAAQQQPRPSRGGRTAPEDMKTPHLPMFDPLKRILHLPTSAEQAQKRASSPHSLAEKAMTATGLPWGPESVDGPAEVIEQAAQQHRRGMRPTLLHGYRAICYDHPAAEPMLPGWQAPEWRAAWIMAALDAAEHNRAAHLPVATTMADIQRKIRGLSDYVGKVDGYVIEDTGMQCTDILTGGVTRGLEGAVARALDPRIGERVTRGGGKTIYTIVALEASGRYKIRSERGAVAYVGAGDLHTVED